MVSPCKSHSCVQCCIETEMPLSNEDIGRLTKDGFNLDYFAVESDGWLQLKNRNGRCIFNDGKMCRIYKNRPEGCKLYPVVYDEDDNYARLDDDCPHRNDFKVSKTKGMAVELLLKKLKNERRRRE